MKWLRQFDPRSHLSAAIGLAVFSLVGIAALVAAVLASNVAERRIRADTEKLLLQYATQAHRELTMSLSERVSVLQATAIQIESNGNGLNQSVRRQLDGLQAQFPEFAWIGVTDLDGTVTNSTGGLLTGTDLSQRLWFKEGLKEVFLGEVHPENILKELLPGRPDNALSRFVDVALPLENANGTITGVLGAQLYWHWIEQLHKRIVISTEGESKLDLLLAIGDGTVVIGPHHWAGKVVPATTDFSTVTDSLVGYYHQPAARGDSLGWSVIAMQELSIALEPAYKTRRIIFFCVLLAGLLAACTAVMAAQWLTRSLVSLATQAQELLSGSASEVTIPRGQNEVSRIAGSLAELVNQLQQEKQGLESSNSLLESRVQERTERIERMAQDEQRAAVTRDRLRLARDLHDTLAHSLMALLTQIRLIRKFRSQFSEDELEAELDQTEMLAQTGLQDARAAITEIRQTSVRDTGIGVTLQKLVGKFIARPAYLQPFRWNRCWLLWQLSVWVLSIE